MKRLSTQLSSRNLFNPLLIWLLIKPHFLYISVSGWNFRWSNNRWGHTESRDWIFVVDWKALENPLTYRWLIYHYTVADLGWKCDILIYEFETILGDWSLKHNFDEKNNNCLCSTVPPYNSTFRGDGFIIHTISHLQITTSHSNLVLRSGNFYEELGIFMKEME